VSSRRIHHRIFVRFDAKRRSCGRWNYLLVSVTLVVMLLVSVVLSAASTGPATARTARKGAMKCIFDYYGSGIAVGKYCLEFAKM